MLNKEFEKICQDASLVGATSIIIKDNKIIENLNYGYSSLEEKRPINSDTVYRIASVSKVIVALAAMKLREEGLLNLHTDISEYLGFKVRNPKYPDEIITIKMLMTQTSSITDGLEKGNKSDIDSGYNLVNGSNDDVSLQDLLLQDNKDFVSETFSKYKPGLHFEYSNFGCGILACIIEKVSNKYFTDYVKDIIFKPLGIDASFIADDVKSNDIASTYIMEDGKIKLIRDQSRFRGFKYEKFPLGQNYRGPAGGLFISMNDLSKILMCLLNDGKPLFQKDTIDRMLEINLIKEFEPYNSYLMKGLQLEILDQFDGRRLYGHFGDAYGVKSYMFFNKHANIGMIFITNGGGYKYQKSGICDVHEKTIKLYLDNYFEEKEHRFIIEKDAKYGFLDGNKLFVDCNWYNKKLYFSAISYINILSINITKGYKKIVDQIESQDLATVIGKIDEKYDYIYYTNDNQLMIKYRKKEKEDDKYLDYNYHTHSKYCDHAIGEIEEYVTVAMNNKYKGIGISDHGPIPREWMSNEDYQNERLHKQLDYDRFINQYLVDIENCQKKYPNFPIYKGLEIEYVEGHNDYYQGLLEKLDYLVLGQHFFFLKKKKYSVFEQLDYSIIDKYAKSVVAAINTKYFKILAHPDIFLYQYISENKKYSEFDKHARKAAKKIIQACLDNDVYLEVNVKGIRSGKVETIDPDRYDFVYPRQEFFKIYQELNKKDKNLIIIGCDAHSPNALKENYIKDSKIMLETWGIKYYDGDIFKN